MFNSSTAAFKWHTQLIHIANIKKNTVNNRISKTNCKTANLSLYSQQESSFWAEAAKSPISCLTVAARSGELTCDRKAILIFSIISWFNSCVADKSSLVRRHSSWRTSLRTWKQNYETDENLSFLNLHCLDYSYSRYVLQKIRTARKTNLMNIKMGEIYDKKNKERTRSENYPWGEVHTTRKKQYISKQFRMRTNNKYEQWRE